MDSNLKKLLKRSNLGLAYLPIHSKGYLLRTKGDKKDYIIINESLSEEETEKVVLHEIGHYEHDNEVMGSYKTNLRTRDISEHEANKFMLHQRIKNYLNNGYEPVNINYINLADSLGTKDYLEVKQELAKYITKKSKTSDCKPVV